MNKDVAGGKWKEIKGDLRKAWGSVTDDEWEKTKGDATAIAGILQQKFGLAKEDASKKVASIMNKYSSQVRDTLDTDELDLNRADTDRDDADRDDLPPTQYY